MTLTVVVGSSGSGKTTFLYDIITSLSSSSTSGSNGSKCIYIRQFHTLRPYIVVTKIPQFNPRTLPYWDIYVKEKKENTIKVGGTLAGEFTAGLSGGQRKLLLFELIYQRCCSHTKRNEGTKQSSNLLLLFDEPFAGVTDDFVPFIVQRLQLLRQQHHHIVLVTNDHIDTLVSMADNIIRVSAIDRNQVTINQSLHVSRDKAILALCSMGNGYVHHTSIADINFFITVEVLSGALLGTITFGAFLFVLFLISFWNSSPDQGSLIFVASGLVCLFCLNPYYLSLVDWRNCIIEESEALLHSSKFMNNIMKSSIGIALLFITSIIQWGLIIAVVDGFNDIKFWVGMLMDNTASMIPFIYLGLYTKLSFHTMDLLGSLPFLLSMYFSTTFSPGSGIQGLENLRYLFPRYYLYCIIPDVRDNMEGCPRDGVIVWYMILTGMIPFLLFMTYEILRAIYTSITTKLAIEKNKTLLLDDIEYNDIKAKLFGRETRNVSKEAIIDTQETVNCVPNENEEVTA